ncbi:MAG TPA: M10 family metallopeptidase [Sphingomicrobium sp.]|nr:M10 family metallopeptidase [Sphingomicrobium sp.]
MPQYDQGSAATYVGFSGNPAIDGVLVGYEWAHEAGSTTNLTVSFPWLGGADALFSYSGEIVVAHGGVTEGQRDQILQAFQAWSNVANVNFLPVNEDTSGSVGDIRIAFSEAVGEWWGYANYPGWSPVAGDIWVHTRYMGESFASGTYNFYATLHEIGHALGLDHSFDGSYAVPEGLDDRRYTVMSYTDPANAWWYNPETQQTEYLVHGPMVYDIAAIQFLYGANTAFHAEDTTYVFASDEPFIQAIWDAGGTDTIDLSDFTLDCRIDLTPGAYSTTAFVNSEVTSNLGIAFDCVIENLACGSGDDIAIGNFANNAISGGGGSDLIFGNAGNDSLSGGEGNDRLLGDEGNDLLRGGEGDDSLDGGSGTNRLVGGSGDDGLQNGIADYTSAAAGVEVDLGAESARSLDAGDLAGIGVDQLISLTGAFGSPFDDRLVASMADCRLFGFAGADALIGGSGADWLDGGAGTDSLAGGLGDDTYVVDSPSDIVIELLGEGSDYIQCAFSLDLSGYANVEGLLLVGTTDINGFGNSLQNLITGNSAANRLYGGLGNDTMDGGGGVDRLYGGAGNDTYLVSDTTDYAYENLAEGVDTARSSVNLTLRANVENLVIVGSGNLTGTGNELANGLTGNSGANRLTGLGGDDRLIGGAGNDTLNGGAGLDRMYGGAGNDTYMVTDTTDYAYENVGEGTDVIRSTVTIALRANVENLVLLGTASIAGTGNDLANSLTGNSGANKLTGLGGDDRLVGGAGNDTLNGGAGVDRMYGGTGDDSYTVSDTTDYAYEYAGEGSDRVMASISHMLRANIENLTLTGASAIDGRGNDLSNTITGNEADNKLYGLAGDDRLFGNGGSDWLEGGIGRDQLVGGIGNDSFVFRDGDTGATTGTADIIHDFVQAEGDIIRLDLVDANTALDGDQAFGFLGTGAFTGTAGELRYEEISGNTFLEADTNGDGIADLVIRLDGSLSLIHGDLVF